jgi:5,10-methylene-tetrahydrofolate dehydrogenase/methenyl tetrahydrofolate cyclohydrolase
MSVLRLPDGKIVGDVEGRCARTGVLHRHPGGVGPMTIAMLMQTHWSYRRN